MSVYSSRELELHELGDSTEWRRLWRSLIHFMVRQSARNYAHVHGRALRYHELAQLVRGYGRLVCGAPSRRAYVLQNQRLREAIVHALAISFAGTELIQTGV